MSFRIQKRKSVKVQEGMMRIVMSRMSQAASRLGIRHLKFFNHALYIKNNFELTCHSFNDVFQSLVLLIEPVVAFFAVL